MVVYLTHGSWLLVDHLVQVCKFYLNIFNLCIYQKHDKMGDDKMHLCNVYGS